MMENRDKQEEKNRRIGWLTSLGVQLFLLVLFYFLIAWREPFPPIPEYGIELGFTSSAGATSNAPAESVDQPELEEEIVTEEQETTPTEEVDVEVPIEENPTVENQTEEVFAEEMADNPIVEEPVESSIQEESTEVNESEVEPVVTEPKLEEKALMKPSDAEVENDVSGEGKEENQEIDARAIYGSQGETTGSNEGPSLALAGWIWDFKPDPKDSSDESGKIIYKIVVDQEGYLVKIEVLTSTVSPAVERKYREAVQKLTFSKTGEYTAANLSTGTVTFVIKSR